MMTDQFRKVWKELKGADAAATVTMASLVEKETAVPGERPAVASVYQNRLRNGMPLQCDPTTIYAAMLENRYQGKIFRSNLESRNAYNTYVHTGLPPGPIANPGRGSLVAALQPAETEFLYFVARPGGSGSHHFSVDLAGHEQAVREYRRGVRKNQQEAAGASEN
ncbi:MAG: endolytic transglycosylase MltG [Acidobacteria bacterium]|nr:endolytic transglycosylase MltG [Acidobacteriota bacterium]